MNFCFLWCLKLNISSCVTTESKARAAISSLPNRNHSSTLVLLFFNPSCHTDLPFQHCCTHIAATTAGVSTLLSWKERPFFHFSLLFLFSLFAVFGSIKGGGLLCSVNSVEILWGKSYLRTWAIDWWSFWVETFWAEPNKRVPTDPPPKPAWEPRRRRSTYSAYTSPILARLNLPSYRAYLVASPREYIG